MRVLLAAGFAAIVLMGLVPETADARSLRARSQTTTVFSLPLIGLVAAPTAAPPLGYRVALSDVATASRPRNYGRPRMRAAERGPFTYSNVNFTAEDYDIPAGTTARRAGTYALRDNSRGVFNGRGIDGAEFFSRLSDRGP